jgi:hypothetical protein
MSKGPLLLLHVVLFALLPVLELEKLEQLLTALHMRQQLM